MGDDELKAVLDARGQRVYVNSGHVGYAIQWSVLSPLCRQWSRNRDVDASRVAEMLAFHRSGGYIPRIVHVAVCGAEGLVCYDGNHRRHVFDLLEEEDVLCLVDVMFDASPADVYLAFNNLNKAVQVPALYFEQSDVKDEILALVKTYEKEYKAFLSPSPRCQVPNFNRDCFVDDVDAVYKHFNGVLSVQQIGGLLTRLNAAYADARLGKPHASFKPAVLEKCRKHGLWLFLERRISLQHVEALLN